ncbi:hypothetical protein I6A94_37530 [Frankia sp. CN4]|nr:hypothetical protein [Frankia nepalensis]
MNDLATPRGDATPAGDGPGPSIAPVAQPDSVVPPGPAAQPGRTVQPGPVAVPAPGAAPAGPVAQAEPEPPALAVVESPRDPATVAAGQVITTLARAMREQPEVFVDSLDTLTEIIKDGGWSAPTLATHLVHLVVGGVKIGSDSPADGLAWRLKHLPRTSDECPCRACQNWRGLLAQQPASAASAASGQDGPSSDLAAIERAGAVGARHAALLAKARAS